MTKCDENFNWSANEGHPHPITNDDLKCRDCVYKEEATIKCRMYLDMKPGSVLYGEDCEKYSLRK